MAQTSQEDYLRMHGLMGKDKISPKTLPTQPPFSASMVPLRSRSLPILQGCTVPDIGRGNYNAALQALRDLMQGGQ